MTIEINDPLILKLLDAQLAARPGSTVTDVVAAAIAVLDQHDTETDRAVNSFAAGELDRLIADGLESGPPLDGEEAFLARRGDRHAAAAERAGRVA